MKHDVFDLDDRKVIASTDNRIILTHSVGQCEGRGTPCCIHNPSLHHMRDWQMEWNNIDKLMLRICEHDNPHPDPDDIAFKMSLDVDNGLWAAVHTCSCNCCIKTIRRWTVEDYNKEIE